MIDMNNVYLAIWNNAEHPDADEEIPTQVRRVNRIRGRRRRVLRGGGALTNAN